MRLLPIPFMPHSTLYALVLIAAVAHALWNAMVKTSGDQLLMLTSIRVVGLVAGLMVAAVEHVEMPVFVCIGVANGYALGETL